MEDTSIEPCLKLYHWGASVKALLFFFTDGKPPMAHSPVTRCVQRCVHITDHLKGLRMQGEICASSQAH